ncbi:hypothetical protein Tco_1567926, partial [Tanacetum coccineum]
MKSSKGKVRKVQKEKSSLQLVNEGEQAQPEPQGEEVDYDLQQGIQMSLKSFQPPINGVDFHEPASDLHKPKKKSSTDQFLLQRRTLITKEVSIGPSSQSEDDTYANIVRDTPSLIDAKTGADIDKTNSKGDIEILNIGEEQEEDMANKVDLEEKNAEIDEDEEHVHLKNPLSSTGTLSSMKNLDNFTFGDQFIVDKSPEDKLRNANMETKVESMVTVLIHQALSSVPPLSTPIIDFSPPKPVSSPSQAPTFTATTVKITTTTLPLQPLLQQQSFSNPDIASRVLALVQVCANFDKKYKLQEKTTQALSSRIFTLELRDLPHKINQTVNEAVKDVVQTTLKAP